MNEDRSLIFDIGLHLGFDSQFYLSKGFSVIGLEARPDLCKLAEQRNRDDFNAGRFKIINKALFEFDDEIVPFYVNPEKDDWGSLSKENSEKGIGSSSAIEVPTVTLQSLISAHGLPYYIKCDIEGGDAIFAEQLLWLEGRPSFVSLEATSGVDIAKLAACGYDRFQLVNQYTHHETSCPVPPREGSYVDARFNHHMSGLFGRELPPHRWVGFEVLMAMWLDWYDLRHRNAGLAIGWLDVHATKATTLDHK
jgi:FkbM family methyltransferase